MPAAHPPPPQPGGGAGALLLPPHTFRTATSSNNNILLILISTRRHLLHWHHISSAYPPPPSTGPNHGRPRRRPLLPRAVSASIGIPSARSSLPWHPSPRRRRGRYRRSLLRLPLLRIRRPARHHGVSTSSSGSGDDSRSARRQVGIANQGRRSRRGLRSDDRGRGNEAAQQMGVGRWVGRKTRSGKKTEVKEAVSAADSAASCSDGESGSARSANCIRGRRRRRRSDRCCRGNKGCCGSICIGSGGRKRRDGRSCSCSSTVWVRRGRDGFEEEDRAGMADGS